MPEQGLQHAPNIPRFNPEHGFAIAPNAPTFMHEHGFAIAPIHIPPIFIHEHGFAIAPVQNPPRFISEHGLAIAPVTPIFISEHELAIAPRTPRLQIEKQFPNTGIPQFQQEQQLQSQQHKKVFKGKMLHRNGICDLSVSCYCDDIAVASENTDSILLQPAIIIILIMLITQPISQLGIHIIERGIQHIDAIAIPIIEPSIAAFIASS